MADRPSGAERSPLARERPERLDLRAEWRRNAEAWVAWAREPDHDSYWLFHREQFLDLLPPAGRRTLDLGCGEGRVTRDLRARGHRVVGVDVSAELVTAAAEATVDAHLVVADAAELPLGDATFDLVVAFMTFQDVDDVEAAVSEAARLLEPGGRMCLAIVHPMNSSGRFTSRAADSPFVIAGSYLDRSYYVDEVERDGLAMRFASVHRPLADYVSALSRAGFLIEDLREPAVPVHASDTPSAHRWRRLPLFLHLRAVLG